MKTFLLEINESLGQLLTGKWHVRVNQEVKKSLSKEQSIAKNGYLKRARLPKNTHLKGEGGFLKHLIKWSDTTDKLDELGLDPDRHHTWTERKEARRQKYNSADIRDHLLKNAVIND